MHGSQQEGGPADPVGQRRAIQLDALPGIDLRLAIERQVIGVLGDHDVGDHRLGRQAALDQPRRRRRLDHRCLAGAAGVFGPAHHQHPELRRDDVEPLGDVLADPVQRRRRSRAGLVLDVDDRLDPGQMRRQRRRGWRAALRLAAGSRARRSVLLGRGLAAAASPAPHLPGRAPADRHRQALGAAAEAVALQLLDDLPQPLVLGNRCFGPTFMIVV